VVGLLDIGQFGTERCLTLQAVGRHGLDEWLSEAQHDQATVLGVLAQAGRGLAAAHAAGVVHGDLTPQRVRVDRRRRVRLVDFERACDLAPEPGAWERSVSPRDLDPAYMAPETRKHGHRDQLSDQYSFCLLAWEALTGRLPPADPWQSAAARGLRRDPVYRALARGLEDDRGARWPDMDSLVAALAPSPYRSLRRGLYGATLTFVIVGGVLGALAVTGERSGCVLTKSE
jgi:serine/threonine protein kinase